MLICMSSNLVFYGVSFVVYSLSGMVRIVIVLGFYFAASRAQCMALCVFLLLCRCAYPIFCHLCEQAKPMDMNMESLLNGEQKVLNFIEQVIGEEKQEVVILNVSMSKSRISSGSMYCDFLRGFVFGIQYLYLSYSHIISIVKGCLGRSRWFSMLKLLLYYFQSHPSLVLGIVIRRLPISVNMWASSPMSCMVDCVVLCLYLDCFRVCVFGLMEG